MSGRHEVMDICDRCGKRFNPVSCGGLVTFKRFKATKHYITLCDSCLLRVEKFLWNKDGGLAV